MTRDWYLFFWCDRSSELDRGVFFSVLRNPPLLRRGEAKAAHWHVVRTAVIWQGWQRLTLLISPSLLMICTLKTHPYFVTTIFLMYHKVALIPAFRRSGSKRGAGQTNSSQSSAGHLLPLPQIPSNEFASVSRVGVVQVIPTSAACGEPITPCCSKAFSWPGTSPRLCRRLCQVLLELEGGSSWRRMRATASLPKVCCFWTVTPGSPWKSWPKTALGVSRRRNPHGARRRWSCYRQRTGPPASKWRRYTRNSAKTRSWGLPSCCRWSQGPAWRTLRILRSIAGQSITWTSRCPCSRRATSTMWVVNLEWLQM